MLNELKETVSYIQDEWVMGRSYRLVWEGGDEVPLLFVQAGYAGDAASVHFRMSFPTEDKEAIEDIIDQMVGELNIE